MTTAAPTHARTRSRSRSYSFDVGPSTLMLLTVAVLGSLAFHAIAGAVLAYLGVDHVPVRSMALVDLDVLAPPPPQAEPEPEPEAPVAEAEPEPEPEPEPRERERDRRDREERRREDPPEVPVQPQAESPAARREAPVDFSGMTLTNDEGSWATQTGSGAPMTGPISTARHIGQGDGHSGRDDGVRGGTGTGPGTARPPPRPNCARRARARVALAAEYPLGAREAGVEGVVRFAATIDERGQLVRLEMRGSDPGWGFRSSCERSLRTRWQYEAEIDAETCQPRTSTITVSCRFELRD